MTTERIDEHHLVELPSPLGFDKTVARLQQAIRDAGLLLIAQFDHAAGAEAAGLHMPPTLVLVYGHPKGGTPIMLAVPDAALDLPLRVLVREVSPELTVASFHPVASMLARFGIAPELAQPLERAQDVIRDALKA